MDNIQLSLLLEGYKNQIRGVYLKIEKSLPNELTVRTGSCLGCELREIPQLRPLSEFIEQIGKDIELLRVKE